MNIPIMIKIIIILVVLIFIVLLLRYSIAQKKERRISSYSLLPLKDNNIPLGDKIKKFYLLLVKKNRKYLKRINYFNKKSKKYEKYIKYKHRDEIVAIDFITNKLIITLLFVLLAFLSSIFNNKGLTIISLLVNLILGYYLLDIFLFFYYKRQTKLIDNELLRAIIVMNNAFKSGKSTLQALNIAASELPEPISDEFKKMYLDMKYGLSVDAVFDRFAKRVDLEEAVYLSSSLTILNKTGGNIVEVFSSIERTLFDKKKLNEELKNISASPNMIIKVLFIIPIVFVLIIYILNPNYFKPLFESTLGYMIIGIMVLMFIIYVVLLKRIMKIEV
ncbi:MAG: type II secretion system F family protein [Bacilli bacterium]